jgi:ferric hydroxamate transport system substrate-binding protein
MTRSVIRLISSCVVLAILLTMGILQSHPAITKAQGATPAAIAAGAAETTYPLTVKHALGETIIAAQPKRVIALEWTYVEDVLALGVQPIAIADIKGYNAWVKIPVAMDKGVQDIGTRQEPNLEAIAKLNPDLIIAVSFRAGQNHDKLKAIAPTLVFDPYPTDGSSHYVEMESTFNTIAAALNRTAEAQNVLKHMQDKFGAAKSALEKAGRIGESFILSQGFTANNQKAFRLFTDNAMATQILERIGLKNAWKDKPQQYGFSATTLEGLVQLSDTNFFYVAQNDDNTGFAGSEVWNSLPFVKSKRAYWLGGDAWLFGGPLSAEVLVELVLESMGVAFKDSSSAPATAAPTAAATTSATDPAVETTYPQTIKYRTGETVIAANPQRIVVLDYSFVDALFTLELKPAGAALDNTQGDRGAELLYGR